VSIRETHKTTITLDVQQLFEVSKAITDRIARYATSPDEMYPYRLQDLAVLQSVQQVLEKNIQFVCDGYDDEIATDEATELDDEEAMKRFLEGDK
jgi:hypothetical protein